MYYLFSVEARVKYKTLTPAIDLAMMTDNSVGTAEIKDNAVTLAKIQTLTKGDVIVGNDSGNPAVVNGTTDQVLTTLSTGNVGWVDIPESGTSGGWRGHQRTNGIAGYAHSGNETPRLQLEEHLIGLQQDLLIMCM